jgi:hypothetical protein
MNITCFRLFKQGVFYIALLGVLFISGCGKTEQKISVGEVVSENATPKPFTIAMIPDTQNYVDYTHQKDEGFAIDASEQFIGQMQAVAARSITNGGDIVFVASVGDVWQHQTLLMDAEHEVRGLKRIDNPFFKGVLEVNDKALTIEIPKAIEGYELISNAGLPFGVAPGNHDYDAMWSAKGYPPNLQKSPQELRMIPEDIGMLHIGGLDNFRSAFGENVAFFKNKPWYVSSYKGGANSAQTFTSGGYTFLNIALEMQPSDEVLDWAKTVIEENPRLPTIVITHAYMDGKGERLEGSILDLTTVDAEFHNNANQMWNKFISQHDQIFMLLCGHVHGQSLRVENNVEGNKVYQIMADYQDRGQSGIDKGQTITPNGQPIGLGDGWLRFLTFDMATDVPTVKVSTYSTYYKQLSGKMDTYAAWYRKHEQPTMSDEEFYAADDYTLQLENFRQRFGKPALY